MFKFENNGDIPEVKAEDFKDYVGKFRLIDVRNPDEFTGELGHIKSAELVTLGPALQAFLEEGQRDEALIFVCRSGGRSGRATAFGQQMGYKKVFNLQGGMLRWNELKLPIEK
jgi:rhodanese-related sulfurtransferase